MNFGIVAETLVERVALWFGFVPVPLVDALFGPLKARAIMSGVSLGVFDSLAQGPLTPAAIATARGLDPEGAHLLCRALAHLGYLRQEGGAFALSPLSAKTMVMGGTESLQGYLGWNAVQWRYLEELDTLVRTGRGLDFHEDLSDQGWQLYQQAMFEASRFDAGTLARLVPVPDGARRLLDLGGGHGWLGATICRAHPPLQSTVIDLPRAVEQGAALARARGYAEVVSHQPGDARTLELPGAEVVLLANLLHHLTAPEIQALLTKVRRCLAPGGTVAIWEVEAPASGDRVSHGDVAALYFRLTSTAATPPGEAYARWLEDATFRSIRVTRPRLSPGRVLVVGRS
jgi:ubiquinone/menaquinone biosynthesis C-methylase UbiE